MNASQQVYAALTNNAAVAERSHAIRPLTLADGDALPAITYTIVVTDPTHSLAGDSGDLDHVRVQIDAWAADYAGALALGAAIRAALADAAALDAPMLRARLIDQRMDYDDARKRYRAASEFYIWQ